MTTNGGEPPSGWFGAWAARRAEPRLWISLAGAGCLLAVSGLLVIAGDAQVSDDGGGSTTPGILLFLLVVGAGYVLMQVCREAPIATAGVTAVVLGVPPLVYFVTFDESDVPPFSIDGVLAFSALVWLVSYLVGPGRGRPVLLGAGLVFAWLFALHLIDDPLTSGFGDVPIVSDDPFGSDGAFGDLDPDDGGFGDDTFDDGGFGDGRVGGTRGPRPDWTALGVASVVFGAGYLVTSRVLDRRRLAGSATPFVAAGHVALPTGIVMLGDDLEVIGTGLALAVTGVLVAWLGALGGRRATTVIGAVEVLVGTYMVLGDVMEDASATSFGVALFVLGGVVVGGAHLLHVLTGEPPQSVPGPSSFGGRGGGPQGPGGQAGTAVTMPPAAPPQPTPAPAGTPPPGPTPSLTGPQLRPPPPAPGPAAPPPPPGGSAF